MKFSAVLLSVLGGAFASAYIKQNVAYSQHLLPAGNSVHYLSPSRSSDQHSQYSIQKLYPSSYLSSPLYQLSLQQPHFSWRPVSTHTSTPVFQVPASAPATASASAPASMTVEGSHLVFPAGAVVNNRQRSHTGSGTDSLALYCRNIYNGASTFIPRFLVRVTTVALLLPFALGGELISPFIPRDDVDFISALFYCVAESEAPEAVFGRYPNAAIAQLRDGTVNGTVYFAQTVERADAPAYISIMARLEGLTPGQSYAFSIHEGGDLGAGCSGVGRLMATLNIVDFVATAQGEATVTIQQRGLALDQVAGRALVVAPVGAVPSPSSASACGAIVRNVLQR